MILIIWAFHLYNDKHHSIGTSLLRTYQSYLGHTTGMVPVLSRHIATVISQSYLGI